MIHNGPLERLLDADRAAIDAHASGAVPAPAGAAATYVRQLEMFRRFVRLVARPVPLGYERTRLNCEASGRAAPTLPFGQRRRESFPAAA